MLAPAHVSSSASKGQAHPTASSQSGQAKKGLEGMDYASGQAALTPPPLGNGMHFDVGYARMLARAFTTRGVADENVVTDEVFFRLFPWLAGEKLKAKSPESKAWVAVRDEVARPEIEAHQKYLKPTPSPKPKEDAEGADAEPGDSAFEGTGQKAGTADAYRTQNDNSYDDDVSNWAGGSAGGNTCNMTAIAMALISVAGSEDVAKQAVAAYLRKKGVRTGAQAKVGGKVVSIDKVIDDSSLLAKCQLEDLCIAAAIVIGGGFDAVTATGTMLSVAKKSGLIKGGTAYASSEKMKNPEVLARAKTLLAEGKRVIVGTVNHYVYLTAVLADGILVHDPAGARVSVSGDPKYLWPGAASSKLGHWDSGLKGDKLDTTMRRVSKNPEVKALFEQEAAALALSGDAKKAAREQVKQDHPGFIATGANNFYGLDELEEYNCRIRVILEPTESSKDAEGQAPA